MIIGIVGNAGVGKDQVVRFIEARYPGQAQRIAFADPLRQFCAEVYDWDVDRMRVDLAYKETPDLRYPMPEGGFLSPRIAMQRLGTEWGRTCYADTWVNFAMRKAKFLHEQGGIAVLSDVRFLNEANAIHAAGGRIIRVVRPGFGARFDHASEREQESIKSDTTINNIGTLEDLELFTVAAVEALLALVSLGNL